MRSYISSASSLKFLLATRHSVHAFFRYVVPYYLRYRHFSVCRFSLLILRSVSYRDRRKLCQLSLHYTNKLKGSIVCRPVDFFVLVGCIFLENPETGYWSKITWITVHQRNRRVLSQNRFIGSSDAPLSKWSWINHPFSDFPKQRTLRHRGCNMSWCLKFLNYVTVMSYEVILTLTKKVIK